MNGSTDAALTFADLPVLEGSRIRVRRTDAGDLAALHALFSDPRIMRYGSQPAFRSIDDAAWYLRDIDAGRRHGSHFQWAIAARDDDRLLGTVTLFAFEHERRCAQIAYAVEHASWRRGCAREAVALLIAQTRAQTRLERIEARVDLRNIASQGLLQRLGFTPCAPPSRAEPDPGARYFGLAPITLDWRNTERRDSAH